MEPTSTGPLAGATALKQLHTSQNLISQDYGQMVSVVILNYNKKEYLAKCIASVLEIDWPRLDVIVVDNASSDGSAEMVENDFFGRVRLIRREVNSPTAGRNQGFAAAKGEFILSIDNDIVLPDRDVLRKGIALLRKFPKVGLLAFKIGTLENPDEPLPEHWWYPVPLKGCKNRFFYADFFSEGAVLFRSQALAVSGGYDDEFFQYFESVDLSLRLIRDGFELLYCPVLTCAELRIRGFLPRKRTPINYLSLRNRLWIVWKHYPFWRGLQYALGRIAIACVRSVRYGWVDYFVRGVKDGIVAPRAIRAQRRPLSKKTWQKIKGIRRGMYPTVPLALQKQLSVPNSDFEPQNIN
jgi:GT2 family glycosyltransferase